MAEHIQIESMPELRNPVLVGAFAGWNDAATVATSSVRFLIEQWSAPKFATLDPEEFYVFSETRPTVKLVENAMRALEWPANDFHYYRDPNLDHDVILFVGIEPQLKWRTFARTIVDFARQCGTTRLVMMGGLIAETLHSRPARLTGSSNDAGLRERLQRLGVQFSRYEGPTGIVGVLHDTCAKNGIAAASIWGNVPHYISATPNPKISAAILRRLSDLLELRLDLLELEETGRRFDRAVTEAVAKNPNVMAYIRQMEQQEPESAEDAGPTGETPPPSSPAGPSDLPSADAIIQNLEDLLKRRREQDDD
ncbi:MAG: PAC2 family protein [Chloroflexi bacterium]|nr:PAC2 family protein [Chloroflexota bacterium]